MHLMHQTAAATLLLSDEARPRRQGLRRAWLLASTLMAMTLQACNSLFYYPDDERYRSIESMEGAEDVTFASQDGTKLHAWFLHTSGTPRGTILFFHGNSQNLTSDIAHVDWLPQHGFQVFAFDYRGYGKSEGEVTRQGLHEDSLAALHYVSQRADVDAERLLVFAESLGGACATAALGESGFRVSGLVLDSTFADYVGMANEVIGGTAVTYPLAWLAMSDEHSPVDSIANIAPTPILFLHSPKDPVVPSEQGRELYEAAGAPKAFMEVPSEGHPVPTSSRLVRERLLQFFGDCLRD